MLNRLPCESNHESIIILRDVFPIVAKHISIIAQEIQAGHEPPVGMSSQLVLDLAARIEAERDPMSRVSLMRDMIARSDFYSFRAELPRLRLDVVATRRRQAGGMKHVGLMDMSRLLRVYLSWNAKLLTLAWTPWTLRRMASEVLDTAEKFYRPTKPALFVVG